MFGKNEIVQPKHFDDAPVGQLLVTSIFYTLQGEGPLAGMPSVFVRLAKCNLACSFCDTFFDQGTWMTYEEIRQQCDQVLLDHWESLGGDPPDWALDIIHDSDRPFDHPGVCLIVTGGEPTIQGNLKMFLNEEQPWWGKVQIESNGIHDLELYEDIVVVISPKCSEIDGKPHKYIKPNQKALDRASALKFVMSADPNSPYSKIPDWALAAAQDGLPVYVSPMNVYNDQPKSMKMACLTGGAISMEIRSKVVEKVSFWEQGLLNLEANRANHEYAAKYAMDNGLILNLQMHLYASLA